MTQNSGYTVAAAMRDEGAFLLEWVCWYRMLGFDRILVATNDCSDASPQMLDLLAEAGWLAHVRHSPDTDTPPKKSAHRAIRAHPMVAQTEWLLICDVDELLVLHEGDGTIQGFLGDDPKGFRGIAFHWKVFGCAGETAWHDTLVHRHFTRCAPEHHKANASFKSMFRNPLAFKRFNAHSPGGFRGTWGVGDNILIDSAGRQLGYYNPNGRAQMATAPNRVTHMAAQMNHYVIRCPESFGLKAGKPSPSAGVNRYTTEFLETYDRNEETDQSALAYADRFNVIYDQVMALPGLARLHHLSCANYVSRLVALAGAEPGQDARYIRHMDLAASLS